MDDELKLKRSLVVLRRARKDAVLTKNEPLRRKIDRKIKKVKELLDAEY